MTTNIAFVFFSGDSGGHLKVGLVIRSHLHANYVVSVRFFTTELCNHVFLVLLTTMIYKCPLRFNES